MEKSARKIEWNPEHKSSDEQEMEYKMRFLEFSAQQKWDILMAMCNTRFRSTIEKTERKIEWDGIK